MIAIINLLTNILITGTSIIGCVTIVNKIGKFCKVIEDNKWITTTKDKALQNIFIKVADILMKFMDDLSDSIPEKQMDIINDYLNKDFEDIYIKETVKEFILNRKTKCFLNTNAKI